MSVDTKMKIDFASEKSIPNLNTCNLKTITIWVEFCRQHCSCWWPCTKRGGKLDSHWWPSGSYVHTAVEGRRKYINTVNLSLSGKHSIREDMPQKCNSADCVWTSRSENDSYCQINLTLDGCCKKVRIGCFFHSMYLEGVICLYCVGANLNHMKAQ